MNAAPITIKITPIHRMPETLSPRNHIAANVANTKLSAVSGQRKLMSLFDIKISRQMKNNASKKTPSRICGLVTLALTMRIISDAVTPFMSPTLVIPFFKRMTPVDSKTSPMIRINNSLAISQILVANQFDAEFLHARFHARADESIELMPKFVERWMRVKLGIARRQSGQQFQNVI